jgi:hypothetical protein
LLLVCWICTAEEERGRGPTKREATVKEANRVLVLQSGRQYSTDAVQKSIKIRENPMCKIPTDGQALQHIQALTRCIKKARFMSLAR